MDRRMLLQALRGGVSGEEREDWEENRKVMLALQAAGQTFEAVGSLSGIPTGTPKKSSTKMKEMSGKEAAKNPVEADKSPINQAINLAETVNTGIRTRAELRQGRQTMSPSMLAYQQRGAPENPALNPPGTGLRPQVPADMDLSVIKQQQQQSMYQRLMAHFLAAGGTLGRRKFGGMA